MSQHFNLLTAAEAERLALLAEECAEVIQAIGKVLRHGYESTHPDGGPTNRHLLETELGHVACAERMMFSARDIDPNRVDLALDEKHSHVRAFLHHQS